MIKRNRSNVIRPELLDPNLNAIKQELEDNRTLVLNNAALPWNTWSKHLVFKQYKSEDVQAALSELFSNKCAYCESSLNNQIMHIEHYRPKKEVAAEDDPNCRGYWWLGAHWENLLPACSRCNTAPGIDHPTGFNYKSGKGIRFPLLPGSPRALLPGEEEFESPVLINPAVDQPSDYLSFKVSMQTDELSFAVPNHLRAYALQMRAHGSIEIYGLNEPGLVRNRSQHIKSVTFSCRQLLKTLSNYNKTKTKSTSDEEIMLAKNEFQNDLNEFYSLYLTADKVYLHATVKCVESEFLKVGLSLKNLLGGKDLHLPENAFS